MSVRLEAAGVPARRFRSPSYGCKAYLAVTSNTVQFRRPVDLHAAGGGSVSTVCSASMLIPIGPVEVGGRRGPGAYHGRLLMGISFRAGWPGPTPQLCGGQWYSFNQIVVLSGVGVLSDVREQTAPRCGGRGCARLIAAALADRRGIERDRPAGRPCAKIHPLLFFPGRYPAGGCPLELTMSEARAAPLRRADGGQSRSPSRGRQPWRTPV